MSETNREQDFSAMIAASAEAAKDELTENGVVSQGHEPIKPGEIRLTTEDRVRIQEMNRADLAKAAAEVADAADERKAPSQSGVYEAVRRDDEASRAA